MRLVIDTLIAVMLVVVLGVLLLRQRGEQAMLDSVADVQQAIRTIESQALYRVALGEVDATPNEFAVTLDAGWFDAAPQNTLVPDHRIRPWSETAPEADMNRLHPRRITAAGSDASFWYNANRGIVRARVPDQMSQQATVDLYNLVNGASIRVDDVDWFRRDAIASEDTDGEEMQRRKTGLPAVAPPGRESERKGGGVKSEPAPDVSVKATGDAVLDGLLNTNR